MDNSLNKTRRSRRVIFDEYTGKIYVEERVQAVRRQSETRANEIESLNKAEEVKFEFAQRQIEKARRIYERKVLAEVNQHKQNLREHIAYKHILDDIARRNDLLESDDNARIQDFNTNKMEYHSLVEQKIKDCSPSARRLRAARKLLLDRKPIEVYDNSRSLSALLRTARHKRCRNCSELDTKGHEYISRQSTAQLILPPISMTMKDARVSLKSATWTGFEQRNVRSKTELSLPSMFFTQDEGN